MADLSIDYLGLKLENPLILAACGLGSSPEGVKKAADAGVGAIVLKSLFEEQLASETAAVAAAVGDGAHPEAEVFLREMGIAGGAADYLDLITKSKAISRAPIIASVNCLSATLWGDFAAQIEIAGADAIELNIAILPHTVSESSRSVEDRVVAIVRAVAAKTRLPIAVKLGAAFSNLAEMVDRVARAGAGCVVLFNRFYSLDFDLNKMALKAAPFKSSATEYHESLRWISRLYGTVPCRLAAGTGVHESETALKLIAAGASGVQLCSVLYKNGYEAIGRMVHEMSDRLDSLGIPSVSALQGRLSRQNSSEPARYERLQYVKALTGIS